MELMQDSKCYNHWYISGLALTWPTAALLYIKSSWVMNRKVQISLRRSSKQTQCFPVNLRNLDSKVIRSGILTGVELNFNRDAGKQEVCAKARLYAANERGPIQEYKSMVKTSVTETETPHRSASFGQSANIRRETESLNDLINPDVDTSFSESSLK